MRAERQKSLAISAMMLEAGFRSRPSPVSRFIAVLAPLFIILTKNNLRGGDLSLPFGGINHHGCGRGSETEAGAEAAVLISVDQEAQSEYNSKHTTSNQRPPARLLLLLLKVPQPPKQCSKSIAKCANTRACGGHFTLNPYRV